MNPITKDTIDLYVKHRCRPGSFITAVLANDLQGAFSRADLDNRANMFNIVKYVYDNVPMSMCGSYENVNNHLEGK